MTNDERDIQRKLRVRQRARPYLFSNSLPPAVVAAGLEAIELVEAGAALRTQLFDNAAYWRAGLKQLGFDLLPGEHPIIPVMLGDAQLAQDQTRGRALADRSASSRNRPG